MSELRPRDELDLRPRIVVRRRSSTAGAVAMALLLIALSAFLLRNDAVLILTGKRTQGQVIDYEKEPSKSGRYNLHAWVRFNDDRNQEYRFKDPNRTTGHLSRFGDPIGVIYDPAQPQHAIVDRGWAESVLALPGALGVLVVVLAVRQNRRKQ